MTTENTLSPRLLAFDTVAIVLLSAVAISPLAAIFDGPRWIVAAAGGSIIALTTTLLARRLGWGAWLTSLVFILSYLVLGPALAIPGGTIAGVVPTFGGLRDILVGAVNSWRNTLTLQPPLSGDHQVFVVPLLIAGLGILLATTLLWRSTWPSFASFGIFAVFIAAASFGASATDFALGRGLLLVILLLVWTRWRAMRHIRTSWPRRFAMTGVVVVAASLIGVGITTVTSAGDRQVLRDHVDPPMQRLDFKSPLSKYRNYYKEHKKDSLFTIDGLPDGSRVRLAVMDEYDWVVWNVNTVDRATQTSAFLNAPRADSSQAIRVEIDDNYTEPWVPTIGSTTGVNLIAQGTGSGTRQLLFNPAAGTVAQLGNVRAGDVYEIAWDYSGTGNLDSSDRADRSRIHTVPGLWPQLEKLVQTWLAESGAASDIEIIQAIEQQFKSGFFSNGLADEPFSVPAGHGAKRIADLVVEPAQMIGNGEQYAAAMALVLQSQGLPARVVLGFEEDAGPTFTGDDISAWVEVKFVESGWQAFDPTPPEDRRPTALSEDPNPVPQPNVLQPPILPAEPEQALASPPEGAGKTFAENVWAFIKALLGYLWIALKWAVYLSPLWLIVLTKHLRKRRRRRAEDPITRSSGGWREVVDRARDLGTRLPVSQTRNEHSTVLAERYPEAELTRLATVADRHVFGPSAPSDSEIDDYWADVDTALVRMRKSTPRWRRVVAWFSPASIQWRETLHQAKYRTGVEFGRFKQTRLGATTAKVVLKIWAAPTSFLKNRKEKL